MNLPWMTVGLADWHRAGEFKKMTISLIQFSELYYQLVFDELNNKFL